MADDDNRSSRYSNTRRNFVRAAGITTVVGLAGCSGDESSNGSSDGDSGGSTGSTDQNNGGGEVTLTFGTHLHRTPEQKEVLFDLLYELGLPERINLESTFPSGSPDQVKQVWDRQLRTGESSPDVLACEVGWIKNYARRGWLENLSDLLPSSMVSTVQDEFFPGHVEAAMFDGDLFAVSAFPGFPTTMYNKPLLEEAGYDPDGENWASESMTWKRMSNIAADVAEQTDADIGYTCAANNSLQTSVGTFPESMHSFGGSWFGGPENRFGPVGDREITLDDEPSIKAVQMYQRFIHGDSFSGLEGYAGNIMPSAAPNWNHQDANQPFMDGNAVFLRNFPFALSLIADELGPDKMGVMPNPKGVDEGSGEYGTGGHGTAIGGWEYVVNPNSEKKEAAIELLRHTMTPEWNLAYFREIGRFPARPSTLKSDEAEELEPVGRWTDAIAQAGTYAMLRPVSPVWGDQESTIAQEANAAYQGNKTAEEALTSAAESFRSIEDSYSG